MSPDDLEKRMRDLECFHGLRVLPGAWAVLRLDGRGFSRLTEQRFDKPFDARFHALMVTTARALFEELGAVYAYTESDEISLLLPRDTQLFDREVEKLVSISAAIASGTFSLALGAPAQFDSRVWVGARDGLVTDYFRWRQADATRCALNGWTYWILRKAGLSVEEATRALAGQTVAFKNEVLSQHGIDFDEVPAWQKRGTGLAWQTYEKAGFNPLLAREVVAVRRRVEVNQELPMGDDYGRFIGALLG